MAMIRIKLPDRQPDCCKECPLVGIIPESERKKGVRQSYCCLGTYPHEALTSKSIEVRASVKKGTGHLHHRPCDDRWDEWMKLPQRIIGMSPESYRLCRLPFENRAQLAFKFK